MRGALKNKSGPCHEADAVHPYRGFGEVHAIVRRIIAETPPGSKRKISCGIMMDILRDDEGLSEAMSKRIFSQVRKGAALHAEWVDAFRSERFILVKGRAATKTRLDKIKAQATIKDLKDPCDFIKLQGRNFVLAPSWSPRSAAEGIGKADKGLHEPGVFAAGLGERSRDGFGEGIEGGGNGGGGGGDAKYSGSDEGGGELRRRIAAASPRGEEWREEQSCDQQCEEVEGLVQDKDDAEENDDDDDDEEEIPWPNGKGMYSYEGRGIIRDRYPATFGNEEEEVSTLLFLFLSLEGSCRLLHQFENPYFKTKCILTLK